MARDSRIPHPAGARFLQLHRWAVDAVGKNGAAVLATIDFWDRAESHAGTAVASRTRLIAELAGFIGRDAVDAALADLVTRGWLTKKDQIAPGRNNIIREVRYALNAPAVASFLAGTAEENQDAA